MAISTHPRRNFRTLSSRRLRPLDSLPCRQSAVPTDLHVEYYAQRASIPGTLLITEATYISAKGAGADNIPGIWNDAQIAGWKKVSRLHYYFSLVFTS